MPIQTQYTPEHYTGTGLLTSYAFTWRILKKADLVALTRLGTVVTTLELDSDYTIANSSVNNGSGGEIVLAIELPSGTELFLIRATDLTQKVLIEEGQAFPASVVTEVFDRLTMIAQELKYLYRQTIHYALASQAVDIEAADPEAGKILRYNGTADAIENIMVSGLEITAPVIVTATVLAGASSAVITHALGSLTAKLIGFTPTWLTDFRVVSQTADTITLELGTECPTGGGTITVEVSP
jgi:hypothetical protein